MVTVFKLKKEYSIDDFFKYVMWNGTPGSEGSTLRLAPDLVSLDTAEEFVLTMEDGVSADIDYYFVIGKFETLEEYNEKKHFLF